MTTKNTMPNDCKFNSWIGSKTGYLKLLENVSSKYPPLRNEY